MPWEEEVDYLVDRIPTAFDLDKVLKQLTDEVYCIAGKQGECYDVVPYYKAIEIVRKGGVE